MADDGIVLAADAPLAGRVGPGTTQARANMDNGWEAASRVRRGDRGSGVVAGRVERLVDVPYSSMGTDEPGARPGRVRADP
jgi:hypothetical protein